MRIRKNKLMDSYLEKMSFDFQGKSVELPSGLERLINREFLTENDCIILKGLYENEQNPKFETDFEKCEWESNETHFHPDEYAKQQTNELEFLILALESSKRLGTRLKQSFPNKKFRIFLSFSETQKDNQGEIEFYGASSVRFHQVRNGCENEMRTDDLNEYKLEAVLEIEI
jgi:hypothetical protein